MGFEKVSGHHAAGGVIMPMADHRLLEFAQESGQYHHLHCVVTPGKRVNLTML